METSNEFVYGLNPVIELLKRSPERIDKIFVRKNASLNKFDIIQKLASENKIAINQVPVEKLNELAEQKNHQGVVASVSSIVYRNFTEWIDSIGIDNNTAVLLLDEIEDPHNLGAILRTAAAAGIDAVLVPKHRQAPVSATVMKISAGTAGRIPIVRIGNVNQAIAKLKDYGFWIAGLGQSGDTTIWGQVYDVPMVFVIGNEGRGMRMKTTEHCDFLLSVPMQNDVESLNASVSTALICYEWRRQKESEKQKE